MPNGRAILIDVGSTTTDIIPILDGVPVPEGKTDYDRLFSHELVYTGVRRTPVCAVMLRFIAGELFATTLDAYLILGVIPEDPNDRDTADGRPATRKYAHARLARMYCADAEMVPEENIRILAEGIRDQQINHICNGIGMVKSRLQLMPSDYAPENALYRELEKFLAEHREEPGAGELIKTGRAGIEVKYVVSGSGEFLAQRVAHVHSVSLTERLGPAVSVCAPAYAVAVLAAESRS